MGRKDKEARRKYYKEWAKKNRDKLRANNAAWVERDPEHARDLARKRASKAYTRDPKKFKKRSAEFRKSSPEKVKASVDRWFAENKEYRRQYKNEYRKNNKEKIAQYRKDNPDKHRAYKSNRRTRQTKAGGSFTEKEWLKLCDKYHHKCLCCDKRRKLTADHVIPVSKGGTSDIDNIQPLCGPCNSKKNNKVIDFRKKKL